MVSARAPRVFNLYDVLGVFFPGTALLVGLLVLIPTPPALDSLVPYLAFIILAFSLGHLLQSYSSICTGDLKIFDETIRNVQSPLSSGEEEANADDKDSDAEADDEESEGESEESDSEATVEDDSIKSGGLYLYILYAILGPLIGFWMSPNGGAIKELRNPNRVWSHLSREYEFDPGSTRFEEMLQVISSRIDDPGSPTRSYRFQAIRNFQRGMWLATWILFAILFVTTLYAWLGAIFGIGGEHLLHQSYLLSKFPAWIALLVSGCIVNTFWVLTVQYERLFIRFLITDYVVLITQSKQEQLVRIVED
ncbi:hypothetical protein [Haloparvum sp. PAK95]|uniref:hypothetical protein n=1 Tax=Haloparvum sp. PAK95 TaxID=3418962 RepID=UPI003D2F1583